MKRTIATAAILAAALSSATALASADAATAHHATQSQRAAHSYRVVATVNKTELMVNNKVTIKATVSPAAPGAQVTLQVKYQDQKAWKTIDHKVLKATGKVTFKDKVGSVRFRKYRVVKPADSRAGAGSGETDKVTVFGWRDLTSIQPAISNGLTKTDFVTFNGVRFPNSVRSYYAPPNGASIDYNLNRDCTSFRGTAGLDDGSPAAGTAVVTMHADGVLKYAGSFALTQSAPVAFPLTNVFRITISVASNGGGLGAMGTPQVLCSF
jgi:hypothetical protein